MLSNLRKYDTPLLNLKMYFGTYASNLIIFVNMNDHFLATIQPSCKLTDLEYGICHLGVIPLRKENSHKSEMVTQLLYGECYKMIEKRKKWAKIRLEWDGYEGLDRFAIKF